MRVRDARNEVILDTDQNRLTIETSNGVYEITVGKDSGDLYINACTKTQLVLLPGGNYNHVRISQVNGY